MHFTMVNTANFNLDRKTSTDYLIYWYDSSKIFIHIIARDIWQQLLSSFMRILLITNQDWYKKKN
jgi:hypothetical protein